MEDMAVHIDLDMPDMSMPDDFEQGMPETINIGVSEGMFQDVDMGEMSMNEVMADVETMVAEIQTRWRNGNVWAITFGIRFILHNIQ